MKQLLVALAFVIASAGFADAQTVISIEISKSSLEWTWVRGTNPGVNDGDATEFRMKCGPQSGQYDRTTVIGAAARSIPVQEVISGSGTYFCAVFAANEFGESGPSNEVSFRAGTRPAAATGLEVVGQ